MARKGASANHIEEYDDTQEVLLLLFRCYEQHNRTMMESDYQLYKQSLNVKPKHNIKIKVLVRKKGEHEITVEKLVSFLLYPAVMSNKAGHTCSLMF